MRLIDDVTERILPGAEFKVTTAAGIPVDNNEGRTSMNGAYRTDEGGQFTIAGLRPGIYSIVQTKAPEGYVINASPQTLTVNADDAQTVTFRDVPLQTLTVWNYVAGTTTPLSGSEFLVTDGDGKVIGTDNGIYRTDENGRFVVTGLEPGVNVHVKQTSVADGYVPNGNPQIIRIRSGEAQNLTFYNEPCGTLVVILRDKLTEHPVKGGVFQIISASGEFIADNGGQLSSNGRYVTDESGQIIVTGLQPVTLVVRQTEAPAGYVLDDTPQTVEVYANESATLTFKNVPTQTVIVQKFVQGTTEPLAGVRFLITDGSGENIGVGEYVTDENGRIAIDGIAPGTTVIARETRTVKGYTLNGAPKSLEVVSGQENVLTFYDEPLSTLIVHCYVDGTDNEPLANVGFKVTDGNDGSIGPDDGVYYTDRAGNIELSDLEPGLTVKVRMFKIAPEYVLDGVPQDIVMES
ncbi:MAG: hypothetical protein IJQ81_08050, partial [Oscillibacter sp.]|nr:hypothetical protein [Oscillibacter sp.]